MQIYKYYNINNNIYLDKTLEMWYNLNKSKNIYLFKGGGKYLGRNEL